MRAGDDLMPFGPRDLVDLDTDLSTLKKLPGWPGYYINEDGEVFTVRRLSPYRDRNGYLRVNSGKLKKAVHRLLAMVFLPPPQVDQNEVRHLDGDPTNNSLGNLAWGTRQENAADMVRHGTVRGSRAPRAILNEEDVIAIVSQAAAGRTSESIAKEYGVCKNTIAAIRTGRNWSHTTGIPRPPSKVIPHTEVFQQRR